MHLARRITEIGFSLYIPSSRSVGRAYRFEMLFRTGVEAIKSNALMCESVDELSARVAGKLLKRLEILKRNGGFLPADNDGCLELVQEFTEVLVKDLFKKQCGGSISRLSHLENQVADAVYFLTYQKVNQYWEEKKCISKNADKSSADAEGA